MMRLLRAPHTGVIDRDGRIEQSQGITADCVAPVMLHVTDSE